MALFANTTAADFKKGDIIMFAMGSSCPDRVAPRADRCLGVNLLVPRCRGSTRENVIFSNSLWTNSEYPNLLKSMSIWSL
jgi:hypothetical protein